MSTINYYNKFLEYIRSTQQRNELIIISIAILVMGLIFQTIYPYPFSFPDSGAYILTAFDGTYNVYRPMGYSSYLSTVHSISSSVGFLFWTTYIINAFSTLLLLYSAKFLLEIRSKGLFWSLAAFCIMAPRLIFSTNFLMSDSLFCSLTTLSLTTALWLIFQRSWLVAIANILIFIALFKVRYSGMFLLPVSMLAIYISFYDRGKLLRSISITLIPLFVFALLYGSTRKEYERVTGVETFSSFAGWQMANNASVLLPMAKEINLDKFSTDQMKLLHSFICFMPDSIYSAKHSMATHYMWNTELPYKQFLFYRMQVSGADYTSTWVELGKLYGEYATQLIKHYPTEYLTRFIIPSAISNLRCDDIFEERSEFINEPMYAQYFDLKIDKHVHTARIFTNLYPVRKVINVIYWVMLALATIYFVATTRKAQFTNANWRCAAMLLFFILIYLGTSSLASPNTTWRYTMPMFLPSLIFIFYNVSKFLQRISIKY